MGVHLYLMPATGERRDERLTRLVAHHLGDAPGLQRPTDFRHDNQRDERRLLLANEIDDGGVAVLVAGLVADDEAKAISPSAGRRINMGKVFDAAYTYARPGATLNAALDNFTGEVGGLRLAKFGTIFGRGCVRIFIIGFINYAAPD